jgi:hypothetical protein
MREKKFAYTDGRRITPNFGAQSDTRGWQKCFSDDRMRDRERQLSWRCEAIGDSLLCAANRQRIRSPSLLCPPRAKNT